MNFIKEWILNLILDSLKDTVVKKRKKAEWNKQLTNFMDRQFKEFERSSLDEEFDYQGLFDFLTKRAGKELKIFLIGNQKERKNAKTSILSKGVEYASAKKKGSTEKIEKLINTVLDIAYKFKTNQIDENALFISNRTVDEIKSELSPKIEEQGNIIAEMNAKLEDIVSSINKNEKPSVITRELDVSLIKKEMERIANDVLLPWMKDSVSYRTVFPKLFIDPTLYSNRRKQSVLFKNLFRLKQRNLVITGEAGAGKTLLLRYIFLYKNRKKRILYLRAAILRKDDEQCNEYEREVRQVLYGEKKLEEPILIFIDGIDEAYQNNWNLWNEVIAKIEKLNNVYVWLGWRRDSYYRHETEQMRLLFYDVLFLDDWELDMAKSYVEQYSKMMGQTELYDKYLNLQERNKRLEKFCQRPFQLVLLIYLIENKEQFPRIESFLQNSDGTLYAFLTVFFECWVEKEKERGTSLKSVKELTSILHRIALEVYHGNSYEVEEEDTAVTDLLVYEGVAKSSKIAIAFYHRSFCEYFTASYIYHSLIAGGENMKETLSRSLKNDITDLIREAYALTEKQVLQGIKENLISGYNSVLTDQSESKYKRHGIHLAVEQNVVCIKNEIIYLLTRLPDKAGDVSEFLAEAYSHENDPYMKLDFAYGAVLKGLFWIALEYAKKLYPGTEEEFVHRSWTLVYLGDVQGNPYEYKDDGKVSWEKSKWGRLKRLNSKKKKDIRFRILDIPILYCFYASRKWSELNENELHIIESAEIECQEYNESERKFLCEQKQKLVQEYRRRLVWEADDKNLKNVRKGDRNE